MERGVIVFFKRYDPLTKRNVCGACSRATSIGQASCVCGAAFAAAPRTTA